MRSEHQPVKSIMLVEDDALTRGAMKTVLEWEVVTP